MHANAYCPLPTANCLDLRPDLDAIDALSPEREALWARLEKATFLTADEKRAAVGYGPLDEAGSSQERKFNPAQLRIPAGQPGGGRWTGEGSVNDDADSPDGDRKVILVARKPGGIAKEFLKYTVRQFVSRTCKASINRELPGQFEDMTLGDLIDLARGGDRAARTCLKLLKEPRFRK